MNQSRLALALALAAALSPLQAAAPAQSLLDWTDTFLQFAREKGARFDTLSIAVDTEPGTANERAQVELRTPERLHVFGRLLALATGPSDSSRSKDRRWTIRFPVAVRVPTVVEAQLTETPDTARALEAMAAAVARTAGIRTSQLQLHRAKSIPELPGMARVPFSLTLAGTSEKVILEAAATLASQQPQFSLRRVEVTPVGGSTLATLSGTLLVKSPPAPAGALSRPAAELAASGALSKASGPAPTLSWSQLPQHLRLQFDSEAASPEAAWRTLAALVAIEGLASYEILELRADTRNRTLLSGLLYF
ncbi:MAG: hypothetical protein HY816_11900 [Candidatus Wallbacteria bacterium]|nr:hypothetical protein [Candidatus Wallbacteria bacterium]